jgi:hypothetical protein
MTVNATARMTALLVLIATAGLAAEPPANDPAAARKALRQACASDVGKVCGGVIPGGGRLMRCMQAHADKVSPACRDAAASYRAARAAAKAAATAPAH